MDLGISHTGAGLGISLVWIQDTRSTGGQHLLHDVFKGPPRTINGQACSCLLSKAGVVKYL